MLSGRMECIATVPAGSTLPTLVTSHTTDMAPPTESCMYDPWPLHPWPLTTVSGTPQRSPPPPPIPLVLFVGRSHFLVHLCYPAISRKQPSHLLHCCWHREPVYSHFILPLLEKSRGAPKGRGRTRGSAGFDAPFNMGSTKCEIEWNSILNAIILVIQWIGHRCHMLHKSEFCFLSIDVLTLKIGWKFIRGKRVQWPQVLKRLVNFRPTVSRGCLLGLTSQEDWAEIVCYKTLIFPVMIHTVLKFPHSKFRFNCMNISLFVLEFLPWNVSCNVRGSQRCFVNKAWLSSWVPVLWQRCVVSWLISDLSYWNIA